MKKLISILLMSSGLLIANTGFANAEKALIQFRNMEKGHKDQWFDFMNEKHTKKIDMLKKHVGQWVTYGNENITKLSKLNTADKDAKEQLFANELERAVALHKRQKAECKKFYTEEMKKAENLMNKLDKELTQFQQKNNVDIKGLDLSNNHDQDSEQDEEFMEIIVQ